MPIGHPALIHAGSGGAARVSAWLSWRPVTYIGLISYSLYLWHWPLIVFFEYITGAKIELAHVPALLAASLLLGALSYRFIEQPFRRPGALSAPRNLAFGTGGFASVLVVFSLIGLFTNGYASRASAAAVQLDQARTPHIPYVQCAEPRQHAYCVLGTATGPIRTLLWGDSHMLAWAPAFQSLFTQLGERAVFAPLPTCPPFVGISHKVTPRCSPSNLAVKTYIEQHPEIETVVLAASWQGYFREDTPLVDQTSPSGRLGVDVARHALENTVRWLRQEGRRVVIIGPIPVHGKSVPMYLALEAFWGRKLLPPSSATDQYKLNAAFFDTVQQFAQADNVQVLNPVQWLCDVKCQVLTGEQPIYRDAHHLSVPGSLSLEGQLRLAFIAR